MSVSPLLVEFANLPEEVQVASVNSQERRRSLSRNPSLSRSTFFKMYQRKADSDVATALCSRPLDDEQIDHVVSTCSERRARPLIELARANNLGSEQLAHIAANRPAPTFATFVLRSPLFEASDQLAFLRTAAHAVSVGWLVDHHEVVEASTAADVIVDALTALYGKTLPITVSRSRAVAWMRPDVAAELAARASTQMLAGVVIAPLHLEAPVRAQLLDAAFNVESTGWNLERSRLVAAACVDRPDSDEVSRLRAKDALSGLAPGVSFRSETGVGRLASSRWTDSPRIPGSSLRTVSDPDVLDALCCDRDPRISHSMSSRADKLMAGCREYSFADLALNPHLSEDQAVAVGRVLLSAHAKAELGNAVQHCALKALKATHRVAVPRIPARQPNVRSVRAAEPIGSDDFVLAESTVVSKPVRALTRASAPVAAAYLERRLAGSSSAWQTALGLADSFDGTVRELAATALHIAKM